MVQRFKEHMVSLLGVTEKHRFLLGVSGGVDSIVLAHLIRDLAFPPPHVSALQVSSSVHSIERQ